MLSMTFLPSPNHNDRKLPVDMIVLHYTGMKTEQDALDRMTNPASNVSAHYVVSADGGIIKMVDEDRRAWHAGVSSWQDVTDTNSHSVGIEIVNKGHEFGYTPFTTEQIAAVIELCQDIKTRHNIKHVLAHSDVAPTRKLDPGELFPWHVLAQHGIGVWTDEFAPAPSSPAEPLKQIGYDTTDEAAALTAFERHFYPEALLQNGERTLERLAAVAALFTERNRK